MPPVSRFRWCSAWRRKGSRKRAGGNKDEDTRQQRLQPAAGNASIAKRLEVCPASALEPAATADALHARMSRYRDRPMDLPIERWSLSRNVRHARCPDRSAEPLLADERDWRPRRACPTTYCFPGFSMLTMRFSLEVEAPAQKLREGIRAVVAPGTCSSRAGRKIGEP